MSILALAEYVLVVCVLVALVVFYIVKQRVNKSGEDEGVKKSDEDAVIEGHEVVYEGIEIK